MRTEDSPAVLNDAPSMHDLVDRLGDVVFSIDAAGRWTYLSAAWPRLTGFDREEVLGMPLSEMLHAEDRGVWETRFERLTRQRLPRWKVDVRCRTRRRAEGYCWLTLRARATYDDEGRFTGASGILVDDAPFNGAPCAAQVLESVALYADDAVIVTEAEPFDRPGPRILFVNEAFCRETGYRPEEVVGRTPRILQGPETDRAELDRVRAALEAWQPVTVELCNYRKDGTPFWVELSIVPVADATGWYTHWVAVQRTITKRKQAEERLRMLEAAVHDTTESVLITDTTLDRPGPRILYVNPGFERMTGYRPEEVVGRTPRLLQGPETDPALLVHLRNQLEKGRRFFGETVNYRKDGTPFFIEWSISPVQDNDGRTTHYVAVQRDVTERRRAEEQLRLLESAVANARDAVLITCPGNDPERPQVVYVNEAFLRLTGYAPSDLLGRDVPLVQRHVHDEAMRERVVRGVEGGEVFTVEAQLRAKDGEVFWAEFSSAPVFDGDGTPTHRVTILRDISATKRFEAERVARERAEEMVRMKDTFLDNMSHELRTPLTSILGFADILRMEATGAARGFADHIKESGLRLLETLNAVLALAELEGQRKPYRLQPVDVGAAARAAVASLRQTAARKGLALQVETPERPVQALLDRGFLDRILGHLVGNAVKFTEQGDVEVRVAADGARVLLTVRDTGVGIGAAFMPHLFEAFKQESDGLTRQHEGNGLGLAITRRLVDLMGGTIGVESTKGEGSVFTVSFPRLGYDAEAAGADG